MTDRNYNSGDWNSGIWNSGNRNSGHNNSGNRNSGYNNSGNRNSGDWNSGHNNSGHNNSGNRNSGHNNSGNNNSGHNNSGNNNSGHNNSGDFNTDEPNVRLFNKDTGLKRSEITIPYIDLRINEWVQESDMTDCQKKADPDFHIKKGTLITRTYHEAWHLAWNEMTQEVKDQFLSLPNFDAEIFKEITGIDVGVKEVSCEGKVVEIDGKKYKLTEV